MVVAEECCRDEENNDHPQDADYDYQQRANGFHLRRCLMSGGAGRARSPTLSASAAWLV